MDFRMATLQFPSPNGDSVPKCVITENYIARDEHGFPSPNGDSVPKSHVLDFLVLEAADVFPSPNGDSVPKSYSPSPIIMQV